MKRIKHLFTALLLLCATMATAHDFSVSGIYYSITDATNKTVKVTYEGSSYYDYSNEYTGNVVIPESVTYNGTTYSVTSIGDWAFDGCTVLTSITIPNSVTNIGNGAFYNCTGLTSITIPNSVTSIGSSAFSGTAWYNNQPDGVVYAGKVFYKYKGTMLENTSITIKDGTLDIADYAFNDCTGLTSIEIPNSVTSIGEWAFYDCTGLTSITIPNSVTSIGPGVFYGCTGLTSITIPNSVTSIGLGAFYGCTGLTSVVIGNSVTSIGSYAFDNCTGLTSVVIGNSVTSIGEWAFEDCTGLTSVVIGNSVTSFGVGVFQDCTGLTSITSLIPADSLFAIRPNVFYEVDKTVCTLYVPVGTKETYASTEGWKDFVNIVEKDFTGIDEVFDEVKGEIGKVKTVYDLSGRVVENPTNGVYILNGKKVIVK